MKNEYELKKEQKLLILLSRLEFQKKDEEQLKNLLDMEIDWYLLFCYAIKNKVLGFVYHNLNKYNYIGKLPKQLIRVIRFYYKANKLRNEDYIREYNSIAEKFKKNEIKFAPLKGISLITDLYSDMYGRSLNDVDCLICQNQYPDIKKIMNSEGYFQTEYDETTNSQKKISRKKEVFWKMNMNNSYPFRKEIESVFCERINFDFCFGLCDNNRGIVYDMLERSENNELQPYDFYIHMCSHLYKEASNEMWIWSGSDYNLVKFVDIREYTLKNITAKDFKIILNIVNNQEDEYILKSIHFTLTYLKEIYNDGYEQEIIDMCKISDDNYLNIFNEDNHFKKNFWERIFSWSNKDELLKEPKYITFLGEN